MAQYQIFIRDYNLQVAELVDDFINLTFTRRFNRMGEWELNLKFGNKAAQKLIELVNAQDGSGNPLNFGKSGILVIRNGSIIFSGPARHLEEDWSDQGHTLKVIGPDDMVWPAMRFGIPGALFSYETTYSSEFYSQTGYADAVIKGLARKQFGVDAPTNRRFTFINIAANANQGYSSVASNVRFDNVLDEMIRVADVSEWNGYPIGIQCIQNTSNTLDFSTYVPPDKSSSVIFSPDLGNIRSYKFIQAGPKANVVMAGDKGQGTARQFQVAGNGGVQRRWGVSEDFIDGSQSTNTTKLLQQVHSGLRERDQINSYSFIPNELVKGSMFQTDYNLGDKVTFQLRGKRVSQIVREVKISLSPEGEIIEPVMTDQSGHEMLNLFKNLKSLNARMKQRENF